MAPRVRWRRNGTLRLAPAPVAAAPWLSTPRPTAPTPFHGTPAPLCGSRRCCATLHRKRQPARGEGAGEHDLARVLADVDEPSRAGQLGAETADVHVALRIRLGHAEYRDVQPAAVVEVELLVLVDDSLGVHRRAEIEACHRDAADHAGFGNQGDELVHPLLCGNCRLALRHPDAECPRTAILGNTEIRCNAWTQSSPPSCSGSPRCSPS